MGDRCYVSIRCRKADLEQHWPESARASLAPEYEDDVAPGVVELGFDQVNYGNLHRAGFPAAIPFLGSHTNGDCYGASEIVHDGRPLQDEAFCYYWEQGHERGYVFDVDEQTGQPEVDDPWRDYWAYRERVRRYIEEGVPLD